MTLIGLERERTKKEQPETVKDGEKKVMVPMLFRTAACCNAVLNSVAQDRNRRKPADSSLREPLAS